MLLYAIIFISGGAILALELLASRIMTPYFGVSLYIWTGILSITLIALALGYRMGGALTRGRGNSTVSAARLAQLYTILPAVAAFAIVLACLVYPHFFPVLARVDLVIGSFVACVVLLFVPLVAASAMNPLLVALLLARGGGAAGDAGAGTVFFISTIGSVAGVFITAFALIPSLSNFSAALAIALALGLVSLLAALHPPAPLLARRALGITAASATLLAALLLWQADAYIGRMWPASYAGNVWRIEARFSSLFGTVKILRSEPDPATGQFARMYFQDGLVQNTVRSDGRSLSYYTYGLESLARAYVPRIRTALVLGLGAGVVPGRLAAQGADVDAVEIDPASLEAAKRYFGFDTRRVRVHLEDARTYLRHCGRRSDVVIVDLFYGDGTPEYLITRDFFRDLRRCVETDGIAIFNTFADLDQPHAYAHFLATLRAELPYVTLYRPNWPGAAHVNSFVVAALRPLPEPRMVTLDYVPPRHSEALAAMLSRPQSLHHDLLDHGEIMTDAYNRAVHDMAESQLTYRQDVVRALPAAFLVN